MKPISFLIINIFMISIASAQVPVGGAPSITGRISGVVIDSVTQNPVDYASVGLGRASSNRSTNGALTDQKGSFKIDNISPGKYKLTISFMGYQTKVIGSVTTTANKPDLNLGRILLSPSAKALNEVVVTGQTSIIENRVDKVVYNAEKDATVSGGNASDVLRKVPMVSVDQDGNVSLRGNSNVKVLINGKPSGAVASSVADAMKMMPADQIKNVEVITSPSAKYDAEGSAGIINIVTKRKEMSGVSGSVSGGLGTRQNNGNANLNVNKNRLSVTGNFGGNLTWPQESRMNVDRSDAVSRSSQAGASDTKRYGFNASGSVSYDVNSSNSLSTGIRLFRGGFNTDGSSVNENYVYGATPERTTNIISNDNENRFTGFDWSGDYSHKFKKPGHEIAIAGQWSQTAANTEFLNLYSAQAARDQEGNNDGLNNEYTAQADYSVPLNDKIKWELGGKIVMRRINSTSEFYTRSAADQPFAFNSVLSNIYDYEQDVHSGYSVFTFQLKKGWGLQAGGRIENTLISGNVNNTNQGLTPFDSDYLNFIPSLSVSKTVKSNTFRLSYSKRIQRPSLQFLNPFRNVSNDIFHSVGNPKLAPEVTQSVELNFSTFVKTSVINTTLYFRHTDDVIENFITSDAYTYPNGETKQVSLSTFQNIGKNNSLGASFFGQVSPVKPLTVRGNLNVYTYSPNVSTSYANAALNTGKTYLMYNAFLSGSYTIVKGLLAETFAIVNAPRRTAQGKNPSFSMWQFSVNKEILKSKGKIGFNVVDPFNERKNFKSSFTGGEGLNQTSSFSIPFRSFGVNFSYQFGKMNFNPTQQRKKRGVNNDDLKQDSSQGQGM